MLSNMAGEAGDFLLEPTLCHTGKLTSPTLLWAVLPFPRKGKNKNKKPNKPGGLVYKPRVRTKAQKVH